MPALVDDGDVDAGGGLSERAGLHPIAVESWIVHDEDADLGRAVHAARDDAEGPLYPRHGFAIHRLAGVRELPKIDPIAIAETRVPQHPEHRRRGRDVGDGQVLQRLEDPRRVELAGIARGMDAEREGRDRAM